MARLPYVPPGESAEADSLYEEITSMGRPVLNLYRVLANQPPALAAFLQMSRYVRGASQLEPGLRELVILATAHELGQVYELAHHTDAARRLGVAAEKLAAVKPGGDLAPLTPAEGAAVAFAREVATRRDCDDATFRKIQELFPPESVVDLVVTTAWYHLCAAILGPLHVELEPGHGGPA
jgi:4-carboxymuconolactone decarboxylase